MTPPPPTSRTTLDPQTLAKLRGLTLRAQHIVEGYVAGLHRSPYHGFSIEFAEHREYAPGDDLRYVDWKVFGRTDKFYLKQFEDETNLIAYLVVDGSESMGYCGPAGGLSKLEYAQCLAATLAWLVLQQQDAVGLVTYDEAIQANVPPSSHAGHLRYLLETLEAMRPTGRTACGRVFHELAERFRKRGVVVILSDLLDDVSSLEAGLKHMAHRRHDVILLHLLDRAELDFPFRRPTLFDGMERSPAVLADPRSLRQAYLRELRAFRTQLETRARQLSLDYQLIPTSQPLDETLSRYLARRSARLP